MSFVIIIEQYFDFCYFRTMAQQLILHLVVKLNWEVFTINNILTSSYIISYCSTDEVPFSYSFLQTLHFNNGH